MYKVRYWVLRDSDPGNVEEIFYVEHTFPTIIEADRYITNMVYVIGNVKERETDQGVGIMREFVEQCIGYNEYHDFEITYEFKEES